MKLVSLERRWIWAIRLSDGIVRYLHIFYLPTYIIMTFMLSLPFVSFSVIPLYLSLELMIQNNYMIADPGFGGSTGVPYPQNEANAADAVMQFAINELGFRYILNRYRFLC